MKTLKKLIPIIIAATMAGTANLAWAQDNNGVGKSMSCHDIRNNYLNDVSTLAGLLNDISEVVASQYGDLAKQLNNYITIINTNKTYPALKADNDSIQTVIKSSNLNSLTQAEINPYLQQFQDQMTSAKHRVKDWKEQDCREKHGCLLGESGTYCDQ